ncbi:MAG: hypothetical protein AB7V46_07065 [Thermomicrobiales bacterium]
MTRVPLFVIALLTASGHLPARGVTKGTFKSASTKRRHGLALDISRRVMALVENGVYETHDSVKPTLVEHIKNRLEAKALALADSTNITEEKRFEISLRDRLFLHAMWNLDEVNRAIAALAFYHDIGVVPEGFDMHNPSTWVDSESFFVVNAVASTFATGINYKKFDRDVLGAVLEEKTLQHYAELDALRRNVLTAAEGSLGTAQNRRLLEATRRYKQDLTDDLTRSIVSAGFPRRRISQAVRKDAPLKKAKEIASAVSIQETLPVGALETIEARLREQLDRHRGKRVGRSALQATARNLLDDMVLSRDLGTPIMEYVKTPRTVIQYAHDQVMATIINAKVPEKSRHQVFDILLSEFKVPIERTRKQAVEIEDNPKLLKEMGADDLGSEQTDTLIRQMTARIVELGTSSALPSHENRHK